MFLPEEVMISSFLRSTIETKPSSSMVPMSPVWTHPSSSISSPGLLLGLVVAGGVDRAADQHLAVLGERDLHARSRPADGAELEAAGPVGGDRATGLGHAVDVEDLDAEAGHELRDLQRHRRRRGRRPLHLVEPEQQLEEAEDRLVGLLVGLLDLGRHGAADLLRLDPGEAGGHGVLDHLDVGGVGVGGELGGDAGLDLLPHPRHAEERRRVHLAEGGQQLSRVADDVHVAADDLGDVDAQRALGDVGERQVADLRAAARRGRRPRGC